MIPALVGSRIVKYILYKPWNYIIKNLILYYKEKDPANNNPSKPKITNPNALKFSILTMKL